MIDGAALKRCVDRGMRLMEERKNLDADIKEVCEEAKEAGFAPKHLRQLCREAMMDQDKLRRDMETMETLRHAIGQFITTPLGASAAEKLLNQLSVE
jgi:uncharacterized protein (UPF0335 family)